MPNYFDVKKIEDERVRGRVVDGLLKLREALDRDVPARSATGSLLLATWNIREFDSGKYGYRTPEAYFYIAEIISRFDLVAIQEVRDGLYPLQQLRRHLGNWWDFLVTDVTLGKSGNTERMAYLFDRRKVDFTGLAAELVIPSSAGGRDPLTQFARSPYVASFRAGWAYLTLATVHIYYGTGTAEDPRRLREITDLAKLIAKNAKNLSGAPQRDPGQPPPVGDVLILGDFNIFNRDDVTMKAITDAGFRVPAELQTVPGSNVAKDKHYDQIAHYKKLTGLEPTGKAGVFDFYQHVYTLQQESLYAGERAERPGRSFKDWRTYRMSDHLPMWIEFGIDAGTQYLQAQR